MCFICMLLLAKRLISVNFPTRKNTFIINKYTYTRSSDEFFNIL